MFKALNEAQGNEIMKQIALIAISAAALAACGGAGQTDGAAESSPAADTQPSEIEATEVTPADQLQAAIDGAWRTEEARTRDEWRNPAETLTFFGVEPDDTVLEIWPGRGWYSNILAPYLHAGGGKFIAVTWDLENAAEDRRDRLQQAIDQYKAYFESDPEMFGTIGYAALSAESGPLGEAGSADAVLTFRNVHNWMGGSYEAKVFEDAFAVLKPGGVLGVVEHRLPSSDLQDPQARSGYVHEDYVKALAANAGFEFENSSEVNANPADTGDHPFGVWTLPPVSRTADREGNTPDDFEAEAYLAIGESDRMTLKFVKPAASEE